jgi:hypothetical protein
MKKSQLAFTQMKGTSRIVGSFFEELVCGFLGGEECAPEQGDFVHWNEPSFIAEVKSSDNTNAFRVSKPQFTQQLEQVGFLFDHHLYFLCKYKNKQGRRRGQKRRLSLIKKLRTAEKIRAFLAQNDLRIHILDRSILEAIERRFYSQKELPLGLDGQECIEIRHRTLELFCDPKKSQKWLQELGLRSVRVISFCKRLPYKDGFLESSIRITVTMVLPKRLSEKMEAVLFPKLVTQKAVAA